MSIQWQSFAPADLSRVLEFTSLCYHDLNFSDVHIGDLVHHLSNGMRGQNIESGLRLYEETGKLRAVLMIKNEKLRIFSLIIAPALQGTPTERALYAAIEALLIEITPLDSDAAGKIQKNREDTEEAPTWWTTACSTDTRGIALLRELGYTVDEKPFMEATLRDLADKILSAAIRIFSGAG